ncbi:MAG: AbrB/MazE/SpoVT family DNA-binding domain-containing protein, partial [Deltaproteobacteria bacterium]|nr:AbrB/MazE/SpoVT family DNA-binding domain-containing protein [Deltaproteobacteria bacterium]
IMEPVKKGRLLSVLAGLKKLDEMFPDTDDELLPLDDITL